MSISEQTNNEIVRNNGSERDTINVLLAKIEALENKPCEHPFRFLSAVPEGIECEKCKKRVSETQNIW